MTGTRDHRSTSPRGVLWLAVLVAVVVSIAFIVLEVLRGCRDKWREEAREFAARVVDEVAPYRVFRAPGLEFRVPWRWHVEPQERGDSGKWDLSFLGMRGFRLSVSMRRGERDAARVIEHKIERKVELEVELERSMSPEGWSHKVIRNDRPLRLAGPKVAGTTFYYGLHNRIGTVETYYALRTGPDAVLFTFSEHRIDGLPGEPSTEWKEMERLLQESLKVLPPTDK